MPQLSMPVSNYMSTPVHTISVEAELQDAHRRLSELSVSSLPVVDRDGRLVGVISRTDLLRVGRYLANAEGKNALLRLPHLGIDEVMRGDVLCIAPSAPIAAAARLMVEHHIHRVFVKQAEQLLGVISTRDVMLAIKDARLPDPIAGFMSAPVITVQVDDPLSLATDRLAQAHVHGVVVLEGGSPVGLFTQSEALAARELGAGTAVEEVMSYAMLSLDVGTSMYRAAAHGAATRVRRIIAVRDREVRGILTGIDMARAACGGMAVPADQTGAGGGTAAT